MTQETEDFLREAIDKATTALNDCVTVFVDLAKTGKYPQQLMGRGWEFASQARDSLTFAAKRAGIIDESEVDL